MINATTHFSDKDKNLMLWDTIKPCLVRCLQIPFHGHLGNSSHRLCNQLHSFLQQFPCFSMGLFPGSPFKPWNTFCLILYDMKILNWLKSTFGEQKEGGPRTEMTAPPVRTDAARQTERKNSEGEQPKMKTTKTYYPIKRRFERYRIDEKEVSAKIVLADIIELTNISTGGACVVTTRALQPGENVLLKLPGDKVTSPLKCTIIWEHAGDSPAEGHDDMTVRVAGLKFSGMDTDTLVSLKDFMRIAGTPSDQKTEDHFQPSPLRFSILSGKKAVLSYPATSPVKTISLGGMLVESVSDLEPGQRYPMALYLPHNDQPIKFKGRIASRVPHGGSFDIGIEFLHMNEVDQGRLRSFIETLAATN